MKFSLSTMGLLVAFIASTSASSSLHKDTLSTRGHLGKDDYAISARMHRQRRAARESRRSAGADREFAAAKMVSKKARRAAPKSGTTTEQPENLAEGTATAEEGCTVWHTVAEGEVCLGVIDKSEGLTVDDFYGLNPAVGKDCQDLRAGLAYCIDTDHLEETLSTCASKKVNATPKVAAKVQENSGSDNSAPQEKEYKEPQKVKPTPKPKSEGNNDNNGGFHGGMINLANVVAPDWCPAADPQSSPSMRSGPNGNIDWLNCGLSQGNPDGKWNPPMVNIHDVSVAELSADGVFAPCAPYFHLFRSIGADLDIPPIFLASFAMQESTCNKDAIGRDGSNGLMQITKDKCTEGIDCLDPDYNVRTAAKYFADTLKEKNGSLLAAIGQYNGWSDGLTYNQATAAANSGCCNCQNNLDYLHQFLNAWAQGREGHSLAPYNNLAVCG